MASGKKLGKRSPDGSLVVFRCQGFTKLAKLFLEGTFPVHYIIVCWGMKKKTKKRGGVGEMGGNKCHTCTTRPITSWAFPSLWKPIKQGHLEKKQVYKSISPHFIKCSTYVHFKDEPFTSLCRLPPWLTGGEHCWKSQDKQKTWFFAPFLCTVQYVLV